MMTFIFIIAVAGCTNIICNEYVFEWLRTIVSSFFPQWCYTLITCPTCLSWWIALVTMWILPVEWQYYCMLPFVCSITAKLINTFFEM